MRSKGLRGKIAESNLTLLAAALIAVLLWMAGGGMQPSQGLGLLTTGITAYILVELNNANALLRIRSRMVSSVFLVLMGAITFLHPYSNYALMVLCTLVAYHLLFKTYQNHHPEAYVFHAFLFIGLGTFPFPRLLLFVPFLWTAMIVQLRSFTLRSFFASFLGLALPWGLLEGYNFYFALPLSSPGLWSQVTHFEIPGRAAYESLTACQVVSFGVVLFLVVSAILHFRYTKFNDKIRTRMFFYMLIVQAWLVIVFLVLQPQHFEPLFRLLLMIGAPLIGHHLALTKGPWGTAYFYLACILILFLACYNLWEPFQHFF